MQLIDTIHLPLEEGGQPRRSVIFTFTTTFVGQSPYWTADFIQNQGRGPGMSDEISKALGHHHWQIEEIYLEIVYRPEINDGERQMVPVTNLEVTVTEFDPPPDKVELPKKPYFVGIDSGQWVGD